MTMVLGSGEGSAVGCGVKNVMYVVTTVGAGPAVRVTMVWMVLVSIGTSGLSGRGSSSVPGRH